MRKLDHCRVNEQVGKTAGCSLEPVVIIGMSLPTSVTNRQDCSNKHIRLKIQTGSEC